jgi:hypothetical protein
MFFVASSILFFFRVRSELDVRFRQGGSVRIEQEEAEGAEF